jgi:twinkle protein
VCGHHTGGRKEVSLEEPKKPGPLIADLDYIALKRRKLSLETCRKWGYGTQTVRGTPVQVAQYRSNDGSKIVAQHIRTPDKDFSWRGTFAKVGLYGRWLWRDGGKMLVITEGEIDAMTVSQLQDHKWPVVSVPNGADHAEKAIRQSLDWIEKFDSVIFMFDNDEAGRKAANECAMLLTPGKAKIAQLDLKDPNDMLLAGRGKEVINAIWAAREFRPDGIVCGNELWDKVTDPKMFDSVPYPWEAINKLTRGLRRGEMVMLTAGTGIGKSEVARQIAAHLHDNIADEKIGYIALEESVQRTGLGFMGLHLGKRLHLDTSTWDAKQMKKAFEATIGSGRYFLYDHWGSTEGDHLLNRIRYMVRGLGCRTIVLDHISIVVSGIDTDDERKVIDVTTTKLRALVEELQINLIVICHLKRVDGKPHEEGGQVSLAHLRGSGSLAQLSNIVIALERNQQDPAQLNLTHVRILKNRHSGETGPSGWLAYDPDTGRLSDSEGPTDADVFPDEKPAKSSKKKRKPSTDEEDDF